MKNIYRSSALVWTTHYVLVVGPVRLVSHQNLHTLQHLMNIQNSGIPLQKIKFHTQKISRFSLHLLKYLHNDTSTCCNFTVCCCCCVVLHWQVALQFCKNAWQRIGQNEMECNVLFYSPGLIALENVKNSLIL